MKCNIYFIWVLYEHICLTLFINWILRVSLVEQVVVFVMFWGQGLCLLPGVLVGRLVCVCVCVRVYSCDSVALPNRTTC